MARLKTLPPRIGAVPARLKQAESTGRGGHRHLYRTARWQRIRAKVLLDAAYTCAKCSTVQGRNMVCDHVNGHAPGESEATFWAGPFQALCTTCHESVKKREEAEARRRT